MKLLSLTLLIVAQASGVAGGPPSGRRRSLEGTTFVVDVTDLETKCGEDQYDSFLFVDDSDHVSIFAEPTGGDESTVCPSLYFHLTNPDSKEVLEIRKDYVSSQEHKAMLYPTGTFKLGDILRAYDQVKTTTDKYDVVTNNCATIVLDMFCYLGVDVNDEMLTWTAKHLLSTDESTEKMFLLMRQSEHLTEMGIEPERKLEVNDVFALVKYYAANHECSASTIVVDEGKKSDGESSTSTTSAAAILVGTIVGMVL